MFLNQGRKCSLSGEELTFFKNRENKGSASLDRIESKKGYIEGNVQWVHKDLNIMKMALDQDKFIYSCRSVALEAGTVSPLDETKEAYEHALYFSNLQKEYKNMVRIAEIENKYLTAENTALKAENASLRSQLAAFQKNPR